MKKQHRVFKINSWKKLMNCMDTENFDRITPDLFLFFHFVVKTAEKMRADNPEKYKDITTFDMLTPSFNWTDDGKTGITDFTTTDKNTGEVHQYKMKNKTKL